MTFDDFAYTVRKGEAFTGATVHLDGQHFEACRFLNCTLLFEGEHPFSYTNCVFDGIKVILQGRAEMAMSCIGRLLDDASVLALIAQVNAERPTFN